MNEQAQNPLGYADPKKLLIKFTIPSIISMTSTNLYNLADQVFIGWKVGWKGTILAVFRNIILLIPLVVILPKFVGIYGIPFSGSISDLTAAVVSILVLRYAFRRMVK